MSLDTFLMAVNAVIWPINIVLWVAGRHKWRFLSNMSPAMWEAVDKLEEWQQQGGVAFVDENPLERARHLWKLCDGDGNEVMQRRFKMLAGHNGYAIYNIMLARRKFWQVI